MATEHAYDEVRSQLTGTHDRMRATAAHVPAEAPPAVIASLEALTEIMGEDADAS